MPFASLIEVCRSRNSLKLKERVATRVILKLGLSGMNKNNEVNLEVHAHHCEVDANLRQHVEDKVGGLERLWPKIDDAHIRFTNERGLYVAEVTLISGGMITRGEERTDNARAAFDGAIDKLERQLRRYKDKVQSRGRRQDNRDDEAGTVLNPSDAQGIETATIGAAGNGDAVNNDIVTDSGEIISADGGTDNSHSAIDEVVVRRKRFALKPMTPEEAALQMDLLGHSFFVFRDATSNDVSVVYRRRSGDYGLIEPVAD